MRGKGTTSHSDTRCIRRRPALLLGAGACLTLTLAAVAVAGKQDARRAFGGSGVATAPAIGGDFAQDLVEDRRSRLLGAIGSGDGRYGFAVYRFERDGDLDESFAGKGYVVPSFRTFVTVGAEAVAIQPKGRIIVAGWRLLRGRTGPLLMGLRPNGEIDRSFATGGSVEPELRRGGTTFRGVAAQPDGRIVAVGALNEPRRGPEPPIAVVARYRANGRSDRSFGRNGKVLMPAPRRSNYTGLDDVEVLPSGKIVVAGYRQGNVFVARLNENGRLDRTFGKGDGKVSTRVKGNGGCQYALCRPRASMDLADQGRIVVQGETLAGASGLTVVRYTRAGLPDKTFGRDGLVRLQVGLYVTASGVAVQPDGRVVLAGWSSQGSPLRARFTIVRLNPDGTRDREVGRNGVRFIFPEFEGAGTSALLRSDGRVVVGGGYRRPAARDVHYFIVLVRL